MKQNIRSILFAFIISSCIISCGKDKDKWEEVQFEFVIPLSITPGNDTINVDQELVLTANFSDSLFDFISQKKYYLPNFDFKTVAVIQKLTNPDLDITQQTSGINKFMYFNQSGGFFNLSSTFADVNYLHENGRYKLDVKISRSKRVFL